MNFKTAFNRIQSIGAHQLKNKDKLYSFGDSAVISLGRFAAGIALAKLAGTDAFAQYLLLMTSGFFILSIPSTLCIIPMVNLSTGLPDRERLGIFAWTHRRLRLFLAGGIVCAVLAYPLTLRFSVDPALYLGFCCATLAGLELLYQRACLQITFKMKTAVVSDLIGLIVLIVMVSMAWHFYKSPVLGFWWGSAISSMLTSFLMSLQTKRKTTAPVIEEIIMPTDKIREQARTSGSAMLVGSIANSACARIAPFALGSVGGLLTVASFGASWTLVGPLRMLSGAISGLLRPRLAMHQNTGNTQAFERSLRLAYIIIISVGSAGIILSAILGPTLISFFFDPSLRSAAWMLPLAMTYATLEVITSTQVIALQTKLIKGAAVASKLRIVAATVSIILIFPACIWLGSLGAYLTLLAAETVYFICARKSLCSLGPQINLIRLQQYSKGRFEPT